MVLEAKSQIKVLVGFVPSEGDAEGYVSGFSPSFRRFLGNLWQFCLGDTPRCSLPSFSHGMHVCLYVQISALYKDIRHKGLGAHLTPI